MLGTEHEGRRTANTGKIVNTVMLGVILVEATVITIDAVVDCGYNSTL